MRVKEALEFVEGIKPHAYSEEQLLKWLNDVEGMVQTRVLLFAPTEIIGYEVGDEEHELLVAPPHDKLYTSFLVAQIDLANGEYGKYRNSAEIFNADFAEFSAWFATRYRPADTSVEGDY